MAEGWVKLYRSAFEKDLFRENHSLAYFWLWCLCQAAYEKFDKQVGLKKIHLSPGQFIAGRKRLAEKTGISESSVYRYLNILKAEEMITTKANNKYTIITIVNWAKYQGDDPSVNSKRSSKRNSSGSNERSTVIRSNKKNIKKEKKTEDEIPITDDMTDEELFEARAERMRKEIAGGNL